MSKTVAQLCSEQKLTVESLVDVTGLMPDRITAIMLGRWTPSPAERESIASALNVTSSDIAWGHKTPIQHLYGHGPG